LTSILDRLVDRGLVTRAVGLADRRTFVITPTTRGGAVARRIHRHLAALEARVQRRVTAADVAGFLAVLAALDAESTGGRRTRSTRTRTRSSRR
jgi:DNA-binding MarR family transcriptional regulator